MNCEKALEYRDDYIDGYLGLEEKVSVRNHLRVCRQCHDAFKRDEEMLRALRDLPLPAPSPGFVDRAMAQAKIPVRGYLYRRLAPILSTAIAACLVVWITAGQFNGYHRGGEPRTPEVLIKINEQKIVNVVVNAPRDLRNAQVTIKLPQQVELVGFPGSNEIEWQTDLRKGKNLLSLPLVAKSLGNVELVTRINHENKSKLLKLEMKIHDDHATGMAPEINYIA
jgi:hypothetical protein